jgi:FkbM family methyltransferase
MRSKTSESLNPKIKAKRRPSLRSKFVAWTRRWGGHRIPTMQSSLRQLLDCGVPVSTVLDVGVHSGTPALIEVVGDLPHHLFEPVALHFDAIKLNYQGVKHTLHPVAVSDEDGTCFLACRSQSGDGEVTHAAILDHPATREEVPHLVSCSPVARSKLDTILAHQEIEPPYLLKIDVDGHELNVLQGAIRTLKHCSIAIIEAPLNRASRPQFFQRCQSLMDHGFFLCDIVDMAYYDGVLWQVDLIFVHQRWVNSIDRLRPFGSPSFRFDQRLWDPLSERSFR